MIRHLLCSTATTRCTAPALAAGGPACNRVRSPSQPGVHPAHSPPLRQCPRPPRPSATSRVELQATHCTAPPARSNHLGMDAQTRCTTAALAARSPACRRVRSRSGDDPMADSHLPSGSAADCPDRCSPLAHQSAAPPPASPALYLGRASLGALAHTSLGG
jgi:hypothetical protein